MQTRMKTRTETSPLLATSHLAEFPEKHLNLDFEVLLSHMQIFTWWRDAPRKSITICRFHPQSGTRDESWNVNVLILDHANISERGCGGKTMIDQKDIKWSTILMLCLKRDNFHDRPWIYIPRFSSPSRVLQSFSPGLVPKNQISVKQPVLLEWRQK